MTWLPSARTAAACHVQANWRYVTTAAHMPPQMTVTARRLSGQRTSTKTLELAAEAGTFFVSLGLFVGAFFLQ